MAHPEQLIFVETIAEAFESEFSGKKILEVGSYDVNGTIRSLFKNSEYIGVDLTEGPGVDIVCSGHQLDLSSESFDITISCECFEHNPHWKETIINMYRITKPGGMLIFTCETKGRVEHGTTRTSPKASPGTQSIGWDYYSNLDESDIRREFDLYKIFKDHIFMINTHSCDLYFLGIKCGDDAIIGISLEELSRRVKTKQFRHFYGELIKPLVLAKTIGKLPLKIMKFLPHEKFQSFAINYMRLVQKLKKLAK